MKMSELVRLLFFVAWLVCSCMLEASIAESATPFCSIDPDNYATAMDKYPDAKFALKELRKHAIAAWYSDNKVNGDYVALANKVVQKCKDNTMLTLVVYGLPNKDCEQNYSNDGRNKNSKDYAKFIKTLADTVGSRKVLYVLEPDAVGLLANGGCAVQSGYKENLQMAIKTLSANANAEIYLDVGFWTLYNPPTAANIAKLVKELGESGRIKGITLNTSNYHSNDEIANLCGNFQKAMESKDMRCIIDSSRNYNGAGNSSEWCNSRIGGIGQPPTSQTGYDNIDYLIWIKPPGDSDGFCNGTDRTPDALKGPIAGEFFDVHFQKLWDQGYFVKEKGMHKIGERVKTSHSTLTTVWVVLMVGLVLALVGVALAWYRKRRERTRSGNESTRFNLMEDRNGMEM